MKRIFILLLTVLSLFIVLSGCNADGNTSEQYNTVETDNETNGDNYKSEPYIVKVGYIPDNLYMEMKDIFEKNSSPTSFAALDPTNGPYALADVFTISNCIVTSITIPIYATFESNEDGNFIFTMYKVSNSLTGLRSKVKEIYEIAINAEEYALLENSVVRAYITVDLSEYDIVLTENQSLAFCAVTDTIIPAYIKTSVSSTAADKWKEDFGVTCMFTNVGTQLLNYTRDSPFFDFILETTYESQEAYNELVKAEEEYQKMLQMVTDAYSGKYLSLLGDSISTYDGITNNTQYSYSMTNHRCNYNKSYLSNYNMTYWGRLQESTMMKLCVINSWNSSKVYGGGKGADDSVDATKDNLLVRSSYLHDNAGNVPDLVIIYMGINDTKTTPSSIQTSSSSSLYTRNKIAGDLYVRLTDKNNTKTDYEIVDEWFSEVKAMAEKTGDAVIPGTTYNTWEGSYALSIENILTKYDTLEIFCMTLIQSNHSSGEKGSVDRANTCIRAIANYFGVGIIDQDQSAISVNNCYVYGADEGKSINSLHLNIKGHEMTTRLIVEALYEHLQSQKMQ